MRKILTILALAISTLCYSQQEIELCESNQKTFTYYSSSNVDGSWLWLLDGDTVSTADNVTITWSSPGEHEIEVFFDALCLSEPRIYKVIVTECMESAIYFPNAFTPNNDNVNNVWGPKGWNIVEIEWTIWNRWGEKIYTANSMNAVWDGSYKGNGYYAPQGVYIYQATWREITGRFGTKIGQVVLIR
jgi:gliding motility-associated-like protein